jgi:hypothetical protein
MTNYYDLIENIYEGFFDTDAFKHFSQKYAKDLSKVKTSPEQKKHIEKMLALPDARPSLGDVTLSAWLLRVSLWGKLHIKHNNPDEKVRNVSMSYEQLISYMDDQRRNATYGKWVIEYPKINLVKFVRKFYSFLLGKETVEEIIVEIDLREDLKALLKQVRKSTGLFGF